MIEVGEADRVRWISMTLHGIGILLVAVYIVTGARGQTPVATVAGIVALCGWAGFVFVPTRFRRTTQACAVAAVIGGGMAAGIGNGMLIVPLLVAVLAVTADVTEPLWSGVSLAVLGAVTVAVVGWLGAADVTFGGLLGLLLGVLVALLAGFSRRQSRERAHQAAELAERSASLHAERAHAEVLAARQAVARDIHDVLAHSLGGLSVQLNAIDALLEAGQADAAHERVRSARDLAASGLREARRAVDALHDPAEVAGTVDGADVVADVDALAATHRNLGGAVTVAHGGRPDAVSAAAARALRRAVQEALSNARSHAPGAPVDVSLVWGVDGVVLRVQNPTSPPAACVPGDHVDDRAAIGGGHGLQGMRERFAQLPGGTVEAGVRDDMFVVRAAVRRR